MVEARTARRGTGTRESQRAYWREHLEAWSESEQSKQAYCCAHGLNPASFYRWQRKLESIPQKTPGFMPVRLAKGLATYPIEVNLGNGVVVRLGNEADGALIKQVLHELSRGC